MAQSFSSILLHLVFSVKNREPLLHESILPDLHGYVAGIINGLGCKSIQVGGVSDHIHALFALSRTTDVATITGQIKTASGKWLRERDTAFHNFHWQTGYGIFSVSCSTRDAVVGYILRQKEHHRKMTFQDEFRGFLKQHNIEYDEKYIWD